MPLWQEQKLHGLVIFMLGLSLLVSAQFLGFGIFKLRDRLPLYVAFALPFDGFNAVSFAEAFSYRFLWTAILLMLIGLVLVGRNFIPFRKRRGHSLGFEMALVAALGIVLRIRAYFSGRSFWLDEVMLGVSFRERDIWKLASEPLDYSQSAPLGFIFLVGIFVAFFGSGDLILRLVPLLCGLATVMLVWLIAKSSYFKPVEGLIFLAVVALSPGLIYYSQEFKHYSMEVFATVFLLFGFLELQKSGKSRALLWAAALTPLMGITAGITLLSVAVTIVLSRSRQLRHLTHRLGGRRVLSHFLGVSAAGLAVPLAHLILVSPTNLASTRSFWARSGGFPPEGGFGQFFEWLLLALREMIWTAFGQSDAAVPGVDGPSELSLIIALICAIGLTRMSFNTILAGTTIFLAIVASIIGLYPFSSRLTLYLVPILGLLLAAVWSRAESLKQESLRRVLRGGAAVPLGISFAVSLFVFSVPSDRSDMKWALEQMYQEATPKSVLVTPDVVVAQWYLGDSFENFTEPFNLDKLDQNGETGNQSNDIWLIRVHRPLEEAGTIPPSYFLACEYRYRNTEILIYRSVSIENPGACPHLENPFADQ